MKQIQMLSPDDQPVRTQITLTEKLKSEIEKYAVLQGISMSEYIRKAAITILSHEKQDKRDLVQLADQMIGLVNLKKHPTWKNKKVIKEWIKSLHSEWE